MLKRLLKFLLFLFIGLFGGMLWQTICLPYFAENPRFSKLWFVEDYTKRQVTLYPRQEITIKENEAITSAIEKVEKSVVPLEAKTADGKILQGAGLILTSDGLIVTLADLAPKGAAVSVWLEGKKVLAEIKKRDLKENLVLLKVEGNNLATGAFADLEKIKKGERVFLVGAIFSTAKPERAADEGIIRYFNENFINTNLSEKENFRGSTLFDIDANVLGLNMLGFDNELMTIPITKIQNFAFSQ